MEEREGWIENAGTWRRMTPAEKRAVRDKESLEVPRRKSDDAVAYCVLYIDPAVVGGGGHHDSVQGRRRQASC